MYKGTGHAVDTSLSLISAGRPALSVASVVAPSSGTSIATLCVARLPRSHTSAPAATSKARGRLAYGAG